MKKLMTIALGLGLVLGSVSFAADAPAKSTKKAKSTAAKSTKKAAAKKSTAKM
jgi:hypothetical protein